MVLFYGDGMEPILIHRMGKHGKQDRKKGKSKNKRERRKKSTKKAGFAEKFLKTRKKTLQFKKMLVN